MFKNYQGKLFCFSPPVMLATFIIESSLAIYTLWRYRASTIQRLAIVTLLALAVFQLSEYMICGGLGLKHIDWARAGYVAITLLPALGIHVITTLAGKKIPLLVGLAYASCAGFALFYLLETSSVTDGACYANYAAFNTSGISNSLFALYYYGWLIVGSGLAWRWSRQLARRRQALIAMTVGYMVFILPTTFFNIIDPSTVKGIPSIMCGFAVLFAIILTLRVLPKSQAQLRRASKSEEATA